MDGWNLRSVGIYDILLARFGRSTYSMSVPSDCRVVVIANPVSSRGGNRRGRAELIFALERGASLARAQGKQVEFRLVETTSPGQAACSGKFLEGSASALARIAADEGADVVAAAGGDGTVGEVANGLIGTTAALAVLPMGTGNDFGRTIGVHSSLTKAAECIFLGESQTIDVGKIGNGHFVNIAGCGFDAVVAQKINIGFRRLKGTAAYVAAVIQTLASFRATPIELNVDGVNYSETIMLCAIANAKCYGGGMKVAPDADLTDGLFDIVLVGDVGPAEFLKTFPKVFKGTHVTHPKVKVLRGKCLTITCEAGLPVLADGEDVGQTPCEIRMVPRALTVRVPAPLAVQAVL